MPPQPPRPPDPPPTHTVVPTAVYSAGEDDATELISPIPAVEPQAQAGGGPEPGDSPAPEYLGASDEPPPYLLPLSSPSSEGAPTGDSEATQFFASPAGQPPQPPQPPPHQQGNAGQPQPGPDAGFSASEPPPAARRGRHAGQSASAEELRYLPHTPQQALAEPAQPTQPGQAAGGGYDYYPPPAYPPQPPSSAPPYPASGPPQVPPPAPVQGPPAAQAGFDEPPTDQTRPLPAMGPEPERPPEPAPAQSPAEPAGAPSSIGGFEFSLYRDTEHAEKSSAAAPRGRAAARKSSSANGKVITIVVLAGCAVVGLVVGTVLGNSSDNEPQARSGSHAPVSPGSQQKSPSPSKDPTTVQAKALNKVLEDGSQGRASVVNSVASIGQCKKLGPSSSALRQAASGRKSLVQRLNKLKVNKLPQGHALVSALRRGWNASARADSQYAAWSDNVGRHKDMCKHGKAPHDGHYNAAVRASGQATRGKKHAAKLWNAIARQTGQPTRQAGQL